MTAEQTTSKILIEIDSFLFYRKSGVGIIGGKLLNPLFSQGKVFAIEGEHCSIKFRKNIIDFHRMSDVRVLEIEIENSCEEKSLKGNLIKQFTAKSFTDYKSETRKTILF